MDRVDLGSVVSLIVALLCVGCAEEAQWDDERISRSISDDPVETCAWPNAVYIDGNGFNCSGTLIHPELVVYAAHCGTNVDRIHFGDRRGGRTVDVDECKVHERFSSNETWDMAWCRLSRSVDDVPIVPPMAGCETDQLTDGAQVKVVGFGNDQSGDSGTKRAGTMRIGSAFYKGPKMSLDGRMTGTGLCAGDSGGPAYIEMPDGSWRQFGVHDEGFCTGGGNEVTKLDEGLPWIERSTGFDVTPCHDADGTWNPTEDCGEFPLEPGTGRGSWPSCDPGPKSSMHADTCGPPFGAEPDAGLDAGSADAETGTLDVVGGETGSPDTTDTALPEMDTSETVDTDSGAAGDVISGAEAEDKGASGSENACGVSGSSAPAHPLHAVLVLLGLWGLRASRFSSSRP